MAKLSDDDRKELLELFAEATSAGLAKYRSALEEEAAKREQADKDNGGTDKDKGKKGDGDGFSLAGFILGG